MPLVLERQRELLHLLWRNGPLSRSELHEQTGIRPNTVGADVDTLVQRAIVCEADARREGPGRPRVPVTIDARKLGVLGLSLRPGQVSLARMNLRGQTPGETHVREAAGAHMLVQTAAELLREHLAEDTFAIGLSTTGFVDQLRHAVLFSSATTDSNGVSLEPVYAAAGERTNAAKPSWSSSSMCRRSTSRRLAAIWRDRCATSRWNSTRSPSPMTAIWCWSASRWSCA